MITDFLIEALQERPNVQVPGLGTFTSQPLSAVLDEDANVLRPPSAEIVFIDDVGYGDADDSIINFIINKTDKSQEEVENEIATLSEEIKAAVNDNESYEVSGLGTFEKGLYGNVVFKNNPDSFSGSSYGLPKLSIAPLDEAELAAGMVDDTEETEGNKFPEATLWGILIPSILIVLVAVWLMLDEGARNKATALISGESTEQTVTANSTETTTPPAEENKEAENATDQNTTGDTENSSEGNDNTADAQNQEETPKVVADNTTTNTTPTGSGSALVSSKTGRFYLSIASYPNESDAMARRQKLIAQGYTDAKVVEAGANKYRVSLADFANRAEANNKVAASKADYDSIWVFKF